MIQITDDLWILDKELVFKASRSSGPGGQNVNKLNTRITLLFEVPNCPGLSDSQKQQILARLSGRADKQGIIRVVSQKFRTQKENRTAAVERLQELLKNALKTHPLRKRTKMPAGARQRRLDTKRRRSMIKQQRTKRAWQPHMTE